MDHMRRILFSASWRAAKRRVQEQCRGVTRPYRRDTMTPFSGLGWQPEQFNKCLLYKPDNMPPSIALSFFRFCQINPMMEKEPPVQICLPSSSDAVMSEYGPGGHQLQRWHHRLGYRCKLVIDSQGGNEPSGARYPPPCRVITTWTYSVFSPTLPALSTVKSFI